MKKEHIDKIIELLLAAKDGKNLEWKQKESTQWLRYITKVKENDTCIDLELDYINLAIEDWRVAEEKKVVYIIFNTAAGVRVLWNVSETLIEAEEIARFLVHHEIKKFIELTDDEA